MAAPESSDEDVAAALRTVGAYEWVEALDEGMLTVVGEGGHEMTAAQAQQLALARLVLADPAVAVLDEATAEAGSAANASQAEQVRVAENVLAGQGAGAWPVCGQYLR